MSRPSFFTDALHFAWLLRGDVREWLLQRRQNEAEAQRDFIAWWLVYGRREFSPCHPLGTEQAEVARQVVMNHGGFPVTRLLRFLFETRRDVRQDRNDPDAWTRFIRWYFLFGVPEYDLFPVLSDAELDYVRAPAPELVQDASLPLTRLMHWLWLCRSDVSETFTLNSQEGRERFLAWFHVFGLREQQLFEYLDVRQALRLCEPLAPLQEAIQPPLTRLMWYVWLAEPAIRERVDVASPAGRAALKHLVEQRLGAEGPLRPIGDRLNSKSRARYPWNGLRVADGGAAGPMLPGAREPLGVNLVGYATGEFGIGEDVRMMAEALTAADIEFCILNRQPGPGIGQRDFSALEHLASAPRYPFTVLCMTAFDTAALWLDCPEWFASTFVIGCWPWELPRWPAEWRGVYALVDEIWCSSRYAAAAFAEDAPVPVLPMPLAVAVQDHSHWPTRANLGLPAERFLFLFIFDFMSYLERKNPFACIAAFRRAFPRGDEAVNLILKVTNVVEDSPHWRKLLIACAEDPRILVIDRNLDKTTLLSLIQCCDAYVSLHRAEGFGRTLAEALLLEKPVIATDYSGNRDYLTEATGFPVACTLVEVAPGAYPWGAGQLWAEPSVAAAAEALKAVWRDPCAAQARARAGRDQIARHYAPAVVGARVRTRLEALAAGGLPPQKRSAPGGSARHGPGLPHPRPRPLSP